MQAKASLIPYTFERRAPVDNDVVIEIQYCGICHTDIHQVNNEWGGSSNYPMVPGHEITGTVTGVGPKVTRYKVGDRVGVGCFVDSCRKCGPCLKGLEQYCVEGPTLTYNSIERDGQTRTQGGYSNKIVVNENYLLHIPDNLPMDQASTAPMRWYHYVFSPNALESRSWEESCDSGLRRLGSYGSENSACFRRRSQRLESLKQETR